MLFYSRSSTLHSVVCTIVVFLLALKHECQSPRQLEFGTVVIVVASLTLSIVLHTLHCLPCSGHILDVPVAAAQFPFL